MRVNVYSQELMLDIDEELPRLELVTEEANTGVVYSAVRIFLHSSDKLHHPPRDDDRSAITFWLPKSESRREALALLFNDLGRMVLNAPPETGLD